MKGGNIYRNETSGKGGGVFANHGDFIMEGGNIYENKAANGGGIYINDSRTFTMKGGTISGNTASTRGGGVYVKGTFNMEGGAAAAEDNDVYLDSGKMITITGTLSESHAAKITPASYAEGTQVLGESPSGGNLVAANHTKFTVTPPSGPPPYRIVGSDGRLTMPPATTSSDLMVKLGIKPEGYASHNAADVEAAFNALHLYLQSLSSIDDLTGVSSLIPLGGYIDLPALTVAADSGGGAISAANIDLAGHGALLRLIVVGRNSFNAQAPYTGNGNGTTAHVVFQFQNVPGTHRMNSTADNTTGYEDSEMRTYLTGKFLTGLLQAGVPQAVLWGPKRLVWEGFGQTGTHEITDTLWLPTEREMFGSGTHSNGTCETAANQARLEYYNADSERMKYSSSNSAAWYWEASPYSASAAQFCSVALNGSAFYTNANPDTGGGCAPAFCVQ
jgi:predicted outer membrane repeat protein